MGWGVLLSKSWTQKGRQGPQVKGRRSQRQHWSCAWRTRLGVTSQRRSHPIDYFSFDLIICVSGRFPAIFWGRFLGARQADGHLPHPRVNKTKQHCPGFYWLDLVFCFLVCYAATQLATQLRQRCIQVVRSNKETWKRLTESNGTPAMDFGCEEIRKRNYTQTKNRSKHTTTTVI